ncbi:NACHT domain-containing NTPase [Leptospira sp. WS4.C2]
MHTELALKTVISKSPQILNKFLNIFTEIKEEIRIAFGENLHAYFKLKYDSFSQVKTILHRHAPKFFYDIYQPQTVSYETKKITIITSDELNHIGKYLTIFGGPGSGKTTLLRHLFLSCLITMEKIPLFIEIRRLNSGETKLEELIINIFKNNKIIESARIINRLLSQGTFQVFLDGFDEITHSIREEFIFNLNDFTEKFPDVNIILTSRPSPTAEQIQKFKNVKINSFNLEEALSFIDKQELDPELIHNIKEDIKKQRWKESNKFLSNPLLLSAYIITYRNDATIPEKKSIFYEKVISALFSEHDSFHKGGFVRKPFSNLSQSNIKSLLREIAFRSTLKSKYSFDSVEFRQYIEEVISSLNFEATYEEVKDDLTISYGIIIEDSGIFQYLHRSLQDYFAVQKIEKISSSNKEKIYKRIIQFCYGTHEEEIGNFLEFLSEMDEIYFKKDLLIPLINLFLSRIDESNLAASISLIFHHRLNITNSSMQTVEAVGVFKSHFRPFSIFRPFIRLSLNTWFEMKEKDFQEIREEFLQNTPIGVAENEYRIDLHQLQIETVSKMLIKLNPNINQELNEKVKKLKEYLFNLELEIKDYIENEAKIIDQL